MVPLGKSNPSFAVPMQVNSYQENFLNLREIPKTQAILSCLAKISKFS